MKPTLISILFILPIINVVCDESPCPKSTTHVGGIAGEIEKIIQGKGDVVSFGWAYYDYVRAALALIPKFGSAVAGIANAIVSAPDKKTNCLAAIYDIINESTNKILNAIDKLKFELFARQLENNFHDNVEYPISIYNDQFKRMINIKNAVYKGEIDYAKEHCRNSINGYNNLIVSFEESLHTRCTNKPQQSYGVSQHNSTRHKRTPMLPDSNKTKSYGDNPDTSCYTALLKEQFQSNPRLLYKALDMVIKRSIQISMIISVCLNIITDNPRKNAKDINEVFYNETARLFAVTSYVADQLFGGEVES